MIGIIVAKSRNNVIGKDGKIPWKIKGEQLQFKELTDIKYVYYEYLERIFKNKDPEYVPYAEEHKKLFEYLHKTLEK